jgi:hypothetical protein
MARRLLHVSLCAHERAAVISVQYAREAALGVKALIIDVHRGGKKQFSKLTFIEIRSEAQREVRLC